VRRFLLITVSVLVCASAAGSGAIRASTSAAPSWKIVALGDSDTTGQGDPTRVGWVGRYAAQLRQKLGLTVTVVNLAQEGMTSGQLLASVRSDSSTRSALKGAQIVLLGIGGADLDDGDTRLQGGKCKPEACYAPVMQAFGRNLDATAASIQSLKRGSKFVLRAITPETSVIGAEDLIPSFLKQYATRVSLYQGRSFGRLICAGMTRHGGQCVNLLHPFNGPKGTDNAYRKGLMSRSECCYPTAKGQQLIADLLYGTGLAPLR
jgi:lysophospholipase L1-like esterase